MNNVTRNPNALKLTELLTPENTRTQQHPNLPYELLRKLILRWVTRTVIGAVVFTALAWNFEWGKWLLWIWIPLAVLSLQAILIGGSMIEKKVDETEERLQEVVSGM